MIVGPNPAMDRLEVIGQLEPGSVHRVRRVHARAGGKSFIVGRSARVLGADVEMFGFLGGAAGELARTECRELGIDDRHTSIAADTRITAVIVESKTGRSTVFNEPGPPLTDDERQAFWDAVSERLGAERIVACTGSLPPDLPADSYGRIVAAANAAGAYSAIDASGKVLRAAVAATPWLVKCNGQEFRAAIGDGASGDPDVADLVGHVAALISGGVSIVVVTMGPKDFLAATADGMWSVTAPGVDVVNATGSGDTFFAAFLATASQGGSFADSLAAAAAGGAVNASQLEPGLQPGAELAALAAQVRFSALEVSAAEVRS
jgi:1-phosphofructokinase family hexose kinase